MHAISIACTVDENKRYSASNSSNSNNNASIRRGVIEVIVVSNCDQLLWRGQAVAVVFLSFPLFFPTYSPSQSRPRKYPYHHRSRHHHHHHIIIIGNEGEIPNTQRQSADVFFCYHAVFPLLPLSLSRLIPAHSLPPTPLVSLCSVACLAKMWCNATEKNLSNDDSKAYSCVLSAYLLNIAVLTSCDIHRIKPVNKIRAGY